VVKSHLSQSWLSAIPAAELGMSHDKSQKPITTMRLCVADQAELMGLLAELHANGLQLVSLQCLEEHGDPCSLRVPGGV
jgi:hypothetical protein